jgi:hypothetical protein
VDPDLLPLLRERAPDDPDLLPLLREREPELADPDLLPLLREREPDDPDLLPLLRERAPEPADPDLLPLLELDARAPELDFDRREPLVRGLVLRPLVLPLLDAPRCSSCSDWSWSCSD